MASTSATKIGAKRGGDYFHKEPEGIASRRRTPHTRGTPRTWRAWPTTTPSSSSWST